LTSIAYSLVANGADAIPTWVTLDSPNQLLNFTTPSLSVATTYTFRIKANVNSTLVFRTMSISVNAAQTTTDETGSTSSAEVYSKQEVKSAQVTTSTSIAAASSVSLASSLLSHTNPQALWALINQFQFYILLPIVGPDIPAKIIDFLEGLDF
jgi:hypothetical protein